MCNLIHVQLITMCIFDRNIIDRDNKSARPLIKKFEITNCSRGGIVFFFLLKALLSSNSIYEGPVFGSETHSYQYIFTKTAHAPYSKKKSPICSKISPVRRNIASAVRLSSSDPLSVAVLCCCTNARRQHDQYRAKSVWRYHSTQQCLGLLEETENDNKH